MPKLPPTTVDYYLGVDIGKKGGIAVVDSKGRAVKYVRFPDTPADVLYAIKEALNTFEIKRAVVEKIWAFKGVSKSVGFSMGHSLGCVEMALAILEVPYTLVAAVTWQKNFNLPSRAAGELDNKGHKERLRKVAQKMFPGLPLWKSTLEDQRAICDALLIADYCRRLNI